MSNAVPFRVLTGTGRSLAYTLSASATDTVAMGSQTFACYLSAVTGNCMVTLVNAGKAATATTDILLKTTDPPLIIGCAPGDKVSAYGIAAGTLYIAELG